jgi:hypothetical protein
MAAEICRRLRFSNDETDQILALVDNHMRFGQVQRMKQSTLKKFLRLPAFEEHLELHRIDCLSSHGQLDAYEYSREQLRSMPPEAIRPTPLITGRDLIEAGYEPGPRFKECCRAVEDAQLEGRLTSRERRWSLCGASFHAGSTKVTATTTWNLKASRTAVAVDAYFASAAAALTDGAGDNIPSSAFSIADNGGAAAALVNTVAFGAANAGLQLVSVPITAANRAGTRTDQMGFNINLTGGTLPQLPAATYTGTLNIQAQATP